MAGLRVFLSSTMRDLANERAEVVDRLRQSNYEPVNAEGLDPTGESSWDRLQREIEQSDLFVLISGESYGWIPHRGPLSPAGLSVTELEYQGARRHGLPVLAFFKRLPYDAARDSADAKLRDAFRARVSSWEEGVFRSEFDLTKDLAEGVARAISTMLTNSFRDRIRDRRDAALPLSRLPQVPTGPTPPIPARLIEAVLRDDVVPLFGAGASISAGLPTAVAFADRIVQRVSELHPGYEPPMTAGARLNSVAADLESLSGRTELEATVRAMLDPPFPLKPTPTHRIGAKLFKQILTTNFDRLLEESLNDGPAVATPIVGELQGKLPDRAIVKFHGDPQLAGSLVLTDHDLVSLPDARRSLWSQVVELFRRKHLLAVGASLRDPSVVELLDAVGPRTAGMVRYERTVTSRPPTLGSLVTTGDRCHDRRLLSCPCRQDRPVVAQQCRPVLRYEGEAAVELRADHHGLRGRLPGPRRVPCRSPMDPPGGFFSAI